jgi:hypothetical protein
LHGKRSAHRGGPAAQVAPPISIVHLTRAGRDRCGAGRGDYYIVVDGKDGSVANSDIGSSCSRTENSAGQESGSRRRLRTYPYFDINHPPLDRAARRAPIRSSDEDNLEADRWAQPARTVV